MILPARHFTDLYADCADPWHLAGNGYELRKYRLSVEHLPRPSYRRGFEPGCSIGLLTELLAARCEQLLACDLAPGAVETTRARLAGLGGVTVEQRRLPHDWPAGRFDLIVLSEVGYYLASDELRRVADLTADALDDRGDLLAVHWRHPIEGCELDGDGVHALLAAHRELDVIDSYVEKDFRLEVLRRRVREVR